MLLPLMIITAAAVKFESSGPVIFRQRRHGFIGREFEIYKFRTMTVLDCTCSQGGQHGISPIFISCSIRAH